MCSPSASYSMFSSFKSGSFIPTNSNSFEPSVSAMPVYSSSECLRVFAMHSPLLYIAHLYVITLLSPVKPCRLGNMSLARIFCLRKRNAYT